MNSTTALYLSRALHEEHRRDVERRHRPETEPALELQARRIDPLPRWFRFLRPAGTTA